jgi:hypothetical protein
MKEKYKELAQCLNKEQDGAPRARRIYLNLNKIESILETGVTIKYLVEQLNENGFIIKTISFYEELGLAKKKLKKTRWRCFS